MVDCLLQEEQMKILVTGGAGFIGSHITDKFISAGNEVFIIDNLSTGRKENLNPKASFIEMDINDEHVSKYDKIMFPEICVSKSLAHLYF